MKPRDGKAPSRGQRLASSFETHNLFTHFTNSVQTISSFPTKPGRTIYIHHRIVSLLEQLQG